MSYEIKGTVKEILPSVSGQSAKGNWSKQLVIIESQDGQYKNDLAIHFFGDKISLVSKLGVGEEKTFYFNLKSRKVGDNWYTEATAWKIS